MCLNMYGVGSVWIYGRPTKWFFVSGPFWRSWICLHVETHSRHSKSKTSISTFLSSLSKIMISQELGIILGYDEVNRNIISFLYDVWPRFFYLFCFSPITDKNDDHSNYWFLCPRPTASEFAPETTGHGRQVGAPCPREMGEGILSSICCVCLCVCVCVSVPQSLICLAVSGGP